MHKVVNASNMDMRLPFRDQDTAEVVKVITCVRRLSCGIPGSIDSSPTLYQIKVKFPFIEKYRMAWPVTMLIRQFLTNHRANLAKMARATSADNGSGAADAPGPGFEDGAGDNQSGSESDLNFTDDDE
jgi:hypothetical protein